MSDLPLFVLYGSATGNAESIAKDLAAKYKDNVPSPFNKVVCYEANEFKKKCLPIWEKEPPADVARKYGVVFVTSTTGNGDSPENGSRFIRYLKRKTTTESLAMKHVAFGVLGLGDTNYDMFCESGKIADRKFDEAGGERVKPLGMADEGTGNLEDVVEAWVEDIVPILAKACSVQSNVANVEEEKKTDEISVPIQNQPGSRPNVPTMMAGRPNVQAILNQRMGRPAPAAGRPNVQAILNQRMGKSVPAPSSSVEAKSVAEEKKEDVADLKSPSPLFILYGSATGNAEQIAKDLASKYEKKISENSDECYFPNVVCCELDQYKKKCLSTWEDDTKLRNDLGQKHGLIVVTSTTGNGDAPENASRFVRFIKRKSTADSMPFKNVVYAVLGLGDTNYDQFCETGKVIDKKLKDLGGTRCMGVSCADEGTGLEQVVDPFVASIFDVISKKCMGVDSKDIITKSKKSVVEEEKSDENLPTHVPESDGSIDDIMSMSAVSIVKNILGQQDIPEVNTSLLPSLGTSLSSCKLYDESEMVDRKSSRGLSLSELERLTVSSCSSGAFQYTHKDPFESSILGARYLTTTNLNGASQASTALDIANDKDSREDKIIKAKQNLTECFPLDKDDDSEMNGKRVIELRLSLPDDFSLDYQPGDAIGFVVSNSAENVKFILDILRMHHGISSEQKVSLDEKKPITVATAIADHIDISSPLKNKRLLLTLAQFATNSEEAAVLKLLASKDATGKDLFQKYIEDQRMNFTDLLKQFPSCQGITLEGLLSMLPGLAPRYYSISSSPLECKDIGSPSLTVAFSVVDYMTPPLTLKNGTRVQRRSGGLATRYLEAISSPHLIGANEIEHNFAIDRIKIFPKPTDDFRLPLNISTPMILIGPGTGVAPFMGFLKEREKQLSHGMDVAKEVSAGTWRGGFDFEDEELSVSKKDAKGLTSNAQELGEIALYYGCRHETHDWLYKEEMKKLKDDGIVKHLRLAFSRDSDKTKTYVQNKMSEDSDLLGDMIMTKNATIYICGDGNAMAKDVQSALLRVITKRVVRDGKSEEEARQIFEEKKASNKILLDIWS